MRVNNAIKLLSTHYNTPVDEINRILQNNFGNDNSSHNPGLNPCKKPKDIILPFCGIINTNCCSAIVYNHGLYTQCIKETDDPVCKSCIKGKYGLVEERIKSKQGEFVTPDGKKEMSYDKFMNKMGYNIADVKIELNRQGKTYDFESCNKSQEKKGRGRPKKLQKEESDDEEKYEIDVIKIEINGKTYFKSYGNVLLNTETYQVVGVLNGEHIDAIEN
tara:strand:+ start:1455 stop:2108 length:654 start_codon:yes stop_codon:yes gene_type:complete